MSWIRRTKWSPSKVPEDESLGAKIEGLRKSYESFRNRKMQCPGKKEAVSEKGSCSPHGRKVCLNEKDAVPEDKDAMP